MSSNLPRSHKGGKPESVCVTSASKQRSITDHCSTEKRKDTLPLGGRYVVKNGSSLTFLPTNFIFYMQVIYFVGGAFISVSSLPLQQSEAPQSGFPPVHLCINKYYLFFQSAYSENFLDLLIYTHVFYNIYSRKFLKLRHPHVFVFYMRTATKKIQSNHSSLALVSRHHILTPPIQTQLELRLAYNCLLLWGKKTAITV